MNVTVHSVHVYICRGIYADIKKDMCTHKF